MTMIEPEVADVVVVWRLQKRVVLVSLWMRWSVVVHN